MTMLFTASGSYPTTFSQRSIRCVQRHVATAWTLWTWVWANPDGATPTIIVDKLTGAAKFKHNHRYSLSRGIPRLREEICKRYKKNYNVSLDPEDETIVTMGSKDSLAHLIFAVIGPHDAVVMPDPSYPIHQWGVVMAEGEQIAVPMPSPEEFLSRLKDLYKHRKRKPVMVLVSFPHNPTTQCVELDFFEKLVCHVPEAWHNDCPRFCVRRHHF